MEDLRVGNYGRNYDCQGVLVDHAITEGAWISDDHGTYPVLCGDIIEVIGWEGERSDGRCGLQVVPGRYACEGHADARDSWLKMSEGAKLWMEMEEEPW